MVIFVCFRHKHLQPCGDCHQRRNIIPFKRDPEWFRAAFNDQKRQVDPDA